MKVTESVRGVNHFIQRDRENENECLLPLHFQPIITLADEVSQPTVSS